MYEGMNLLYFNVQKLGKYIFANDYDDPFGTSFWFCLSILPPPPLLSSSSSLFITTTLKQKTPE
ncbi:hypothetical protein DERP_014364 [Dermatophagoides pteronyssinus]|uniref:Uncharacterized protein n=1 Tax=Dermatophagoides pteronyssinus TaxID=6956 RepID=A0ABQ8IUZ7_DERPT|nr:hypothetical protein DERP_014364 [Dermatophagoides pteronyssinus]